MGPEVATEILELSVSLTVVQLPEVPNQQIAVGEGPVDSLLDFVGANLAATDAVVEVAGIVDVVLSFVAVVVVAELGFSTSEIATA